MLLVGTGTALIALRTLRAIAEQVRANVEAANAAAENAAAATVSAETAARALRLTYWPIIDIMRLRADLIPPGMPLRVRLSCRVFNAGSVAARFVEISQVCRIVGGADVGGSASKPVLVSPRKGFAVNMPPLTLTPAHVAHGKVTVDFQIRVRTRDILGNERWEVFTRRVHVPLNGDAVQPVAMSDSLYGWNKGFENPNE
jgi:hypothetical protein